MVIPENVTEAKLASYPKVTSLVTCEMKFDPSLLGSSEAASGQHLGTRSTFLPELTGI